MKGLVAFLALILILSPLALLIQSYFVYSDSPFLSSDLGSVRAQNVLNHVFNVTPKDRIYVIVNGSYSQALQEVNSSLRYLNDARLITPFDYVDSVMKGYNETILPLVEKAYKGLLPLHELYLNLSLKRDEALSNLTSLQYELNVTYGVPQGLPPKPSPELLAFSTIYENLSRVMPPLEAARNASLEVFRDPLVLLFSFDNYSNETLVIKALSDNASLVYLVNSLSKTDLPSEAIEQPFAYAYDEVRSQIPPPPVSISDFHKGDSWLFIVEVPDNESLSNVLLFMRSINGTVTGHLPLYAESEAETERNLRLVDIATVVILGVLLIVLLRSIYPILILLLSALFGLDIAYGSMLLLHYLGLYQIYYISGLVVPPIVFGITVDYSMLFLYRYYEELGKMSGDPLVKAYRNVRSAILVSGLTIAIGFASFVLTPSLLLQNIGIALLISAVSSLIPPLTFMRVALGSVSLRVLKFPRKEVPKATDVRQAYLRKASLWSVRHKWAVVAVYILLTALAYHVSSSLLGFAVFFSFHYTGEGLIAVPIESFKSPPGTNVEIAEILSTSSSAYKGLEELKDYFNYSVDYLILKGNPNESYSRIYNLSEALIKRGALVFGPASLGNYTFENATYLTNAYYKDNYTLMVVYLPHPVFTKQAIEMTGYLQKFGLVAGENAQRIDVVDDATQKYYNITLPLTVLLIAVYLAISLRSAFMTLRLVLTLFASSLIGLAVTYLIFGSLYWLTPLVVFAILFSLGIDYDMFIVVRSLEESGTPTERLVRAIMNTGLAVTSAGLVLAGAFFSLYFSNMRFLQEIGIGVALTILMDTFVVRTIVVPAVVSLAEKYAWWPRRLENDNRY